MLVYLMQKDVQEHIREEVRVEMARRRISQIELAKEAGISRSYISSCLSGSADVLSSKWLRVFEVLGLELTIRKKAD